MRNAIEAVKRAAYKSKRQRDNWKARYVALVAMLRDDDFAETIACDCHDPAHDERSCPTCISRMDGIDAYRDRLLAKIDEGKEIQK